MSLFHCLRLLSGSLRTCVDCPRLGSSGQAVVPIGAWVIGKDTTSPVLLECNSQIYSTQWAGGVSVELSTRCYLTRNHTLYGLPILPILTFLVRPSSKATCIQVLVTGSTFKGKPSYAISGICLIFLWFPSHQLSINLKQAQGYELRIWILILFTKRVSTLRLSFVVWKMRGLDYVCCKVPLSFTLYLLLFYTGKKKKNKKISKQ